MTLLKTSFLSFIATAIKMLSGLVINKAVAVFIGPAGLALIGQLQNIMQFSMTAAQGGINTGVTKYTAEYGRDGEALPALFSTGAVVSIIFSLLVGVTSIISAPYAAQSFLRSSEYAYIFVLFGFTVPLFVANQFLLSVLNGLKEVKTFISANIFQSLYSLIFTSLAIVFFGLHGALVALVTNQSIVFLVLVCLLRKYAIIRWELFIHRFSFVQCKKLLKYSAMTLASGVAVPVTHLVIRNYLGENLGWDKAGYWQAIWYISTMYLTVVTTALGVYYLPRLSEITDKNELRRELSKGYKVIMPIVIVMALTIFFLRDFVVWMLFDSSFTPMLELFAWQLVGDVVKIAAWLLAYLMLAKAMTLPFILTELISSFVFVVLSVVFVKIYGLVGITYAFTLNYIVYFCILYFPVRRRLL